MTSIGDREDSMTHLSRAISRQGGIRFLNSFAVFQLSC